MKSIKKIFMVLAVSMLMFSLVLATSYAITVPKNEKKDTGIIINSKSKTISYKITWNANGGKIWAKKTVTTSVKKDSKIGNLATTPKRSGYTFKGWYTKKSGGTKITKNSVPKKSITCYAQWKKNSRSLSAEEKKLVGSWATSSITPGLWYDIGGGYEEFRGSSAYLTAYKFNSDGTYMEAWADTDSYFLNKGNWKVSSNGKLLLTNTIGTYSSKKYSSSNYVNKKLSDKTHFYKFSTDSNQYGVRITYLGDTATASDLDKTYFYYFYKRQ